MIFFLISLLLDSDFKPSKVDILKTDKIHWQIEGTKDHFVTKPKYIRRHSDGFIFFDDHDLLFYEFDLFGQAKKTFGSSGQGPGELNKIIRGIFFDQNKIFVSHSNGFRLEILDNQGKHQKTMKTTFSNHGFIYKDNASHVEGDMTGSVFEWKGGNGASIEFDLSTLVESGVTVRGYSAMNWENYLLICSKSSNGNCICYVVIDTYLGEIVDARTLPTVSQNDKETYITRFGENFLPYVVLDVNASPELGFTILEGSSFSKKTSNGGSFIIVHCINPKTQTHIIKKIFFNESGSNSILHVKGDLWVVGYSGGIELIELRLISSSVIH